jgi:uncharacterized protein (TIGR02996 family)
MPENEALLQAVLDNPDDDAPRLAYADWCALQPEEASVARAEFIRGQIELAHMPAEILEHGLAHRLQSRMDKLSSVYGQTWTAPSLPFVKSYDFERGFVELVALDADSLLRNGPRIFTAAPVRHMDLRGVRDVGEELFSSPSLARLKSLNMNDCGLYTFHIRLLAASGVTANLCWLSLTRNHLDLEAARAMAASPYFTNLKFASFDDNPVDPCEQLGWDSGVVVSAWLPPPGEELEKEFGYLPWLHKPNGQMDRFRC